MSKKKSILFVIDVPMTERDVHRYGVIQLNNIYNVFVLDCSCYSAKSYKGSILLNTFEKYYRLEELNSIKEFITSNNFTLYVDLISISNLKVFRLRNLFRATGIKRLLYRLNDIPNFGEIERISIKLKKLFSSKGSLLSISEKVFGKLLFLLTPKADIALLAGESALKKYSSLATKIFSTHSIDYETYQKDNISSRKALSRKKYAVFLDQSAPNHPDYEFHNIVPPVSYEKYYPAMLSFFERMENIHELEIIIAGHPKSQAGKEVWGDKTFIIGETTRLVKDSSLVMAHYTTAISFAVLSKKPILQITSNEYKESIRKDRLKGFKEILNLATVNIDNYSDQDILKSIFNIDKLAYSKYTYEYLKSSHIDLEDLWDWQQFV